MRPTINAVCIIGPPASGKSTLARSLDGLPGLVTIGTGDLLRRLAAVNDHQSVIGRYLERGQLLPSRALLAILRAHWQALIQRGELRPDRDRLLLEGAPRDGEQASMLIAELRIRGVVEYVCDDDEELVRRMRERGDARDDVQLGRRRISGYRERQPEVRTACAAFPALRLDATNPPLVNLAAAADFLARPPTTAAEPAAATDEVREPSVAAAT